MRKAGIPIALVVFLISASPVFAASRWSFGSFFNFFNRDAYRSATVSTQKREGFSTYTNPTPSCTTAPPECIDAQGNLSLCDPRPGVTWCIPNTTKELRKLTDTPRPTRVMPIEKNEERNQNENKEEPKNKEKEREINTERNNEDAKLKRLQNVKEVVARLLDNYQKRLTKYNDFLTKVKTRRDKLAVEGKDVAKLDSFIATATANLSAAQTVFTNVKTTLLALDYTGDMQTLRKSIKEELTKLRQAMTTLHKSMSEAVSDIIATTTRKSDFGKPTPKNEGQRNRPTEKQKEMPEQSQ